MTSISVNNAAKNVQNLQNGRSPFDARMNGKSFCEENSFQSAIDMYKKPMDIGVSKKFESPVSSSLEKNQQYAQKGTAKDSVKENGMEKMKTDKTFSKDELDAVEDAAEKIISQVAEELNVSEEEVKEALESLGICVFDLGNANQMAALFTEILGMSDSMQIVTDGDLFASLTSLTQSIDDVIQSLQNELQIPVEEMLAQLEKQISDVGEIDVSQKTYDAGFGMETENAVEDVVVQEVVSSNQMDLEDIVGEKTTQVEPVQTESVSDDTLGVEVSQESVSSELQNRDSENQDAKQSLNQNTFSVFTETTQTVAVEGMDTNNISYATFNDIMDQIGDYVRTNVTADVKQMEIQLSPANLGPVHINIASKNGVVTAQITAENEMVKNAIESQVVQLKERLEGQGVKIEAVEVTVASHEFERNLDQNNENREAKEEEKKVFSKKWNLSEMDGEFFEGEELTESEQVELDMMKLTGNQLNYMV